MKITKSQLKQVIKKLVEEENKNTDLIKADEVYLDEIDFGSWDDEVDTFKEVAAKQNDTNKDNMTLVDFVSGLIYEISSLDAFKDDITQDLKSSDIIEVPVIGNAADQAEFEELVSNFAREHNLPTEDAIIFSDSDIYLD